MIKVYLRGTILLPVLLLTACSLFSPYRETDCNYTPEHYGQCYADLGYHSRSYEALTKYCAKRGKTLSLEKYQKAHEDRLKEICAQPAEVFRLSYRQSMRSPYLQACPVSLLTTDELKKAAKDGLAAGYALRGSAGNARNARAAEERRREADNNGVGTALTDRITKTSSEEYSDREESDDKKYRTLIAQYPKVNDSYLTETLKCTTEGVY